MTFIQLVSKPRELGLFALFRTSSGKEQLSEERVNRVS